MQVLISNFVFAFSVDNFQIGIKHNLSSVYDIVQICNIV